MRFGLKRSLLMRQTRTAPADRLRRRRGVAALEFAVASPLLIMMLGGAADLGLAQYSRAMLANGVAAGAEYAYLIGSGASPANVGTTVTQANITSVVQNASGLPNATSSVTVTFSSISPGVPGPGWYCLTGTGPTVTPSSQGTTCTDGSAAGYYVSLKASYTVNGLMNGFMAALTQTVSEQATVKVQ